MSSNEVWLWLGAEAGLCPMTRVVGLLESSVVGLPMFAFKRRRLPTEVILVCVRWYCKYDKSATADLAEMMQERGVMVDHTTIFRWVQRYAPEIERRVRGIKATARHPGRSIKPMSEWAARGNTCFVPSIRWGG